jgi:alpha-galactosidase
MTKITFIGAGSLEFTRKLVRDLLTFPLLENATIDMERYCPGALMLDYTNPMVMLCRAMQRKTAIKLTGLCHSVQGTAAMLARWIGAPMAEITYTCAGINHMAWYLDYKWKGEDAYPLIRRAVAEREEVYNEEIVRNEMFLHLDYYVTESRCRFAGIVIFLSGRVAGQLPLRLFNFAPS